MSEEVRFRFVASDHGTVVDAFRSIEAAAVRARRVTSQSVSIGRGGPERAAAATERAESRAAAATERAAARASRAQERAATAAERAQKRLAATTEREAARAYRAQAKLAVQGYQYQKANAEKAQQAWRKNLDTSVGAVKSLSVKGLFAAGGAAAAALRVVGAAARESVQLNDIARRVSIAGRGAGEKALNPTTLQREFENTAVATPGITATDVAEGTATFVQKTGRIDLARGLQRVFATSASATDTSYNDIASTAAEVFQKFDIKSIDDMREAFARLTFQGKDGAFEIKDAASYFSELASAAKRFNIGTGPAALATLGGLSQLAKTGNATGAETSTSVQAMFSALIAQAPRLRTQGVRVFDDSGKTRDIRTVLTETVGLVGGGSLEKKKAGLQSIFGKQGIRAVDPLISEFEKGFDASKGSEPERVAAGMRALRASIDRAIDAPGAWKDLTEDAAAAQASTGAQLTAAWETLKARTTETVTPALVSLAPKILRLVDAMDPAIEVFGILTDALGETIDFLQEAGLVKKRRKTLAQAQEDLAAYDEKHPNAGPPTLQQFKARQALVDAVDAAAAREQTSQYRTPLSEDEFVTEFVAKRARDSSGNKYVEGVRQKRAESEGRALYRKIQENPNEIRGQLDFWDKFGLSGNTEGQNSIIREATEARTSEIAQGKAAVVTGDAETKQFATTVSVATTALHAFVGSLNEARGTRISGERFP